MSQRTGEIFDAKKGRPAEPTPKVLGAPVAGEPKVLDKRSPVEKTEIPLVKHEEIVTVKEHIRSKPQRKNEPEVRIRTMSREEREAWNRAKHGED